MGSEALPREVTSHASSSTNSSAGGDGDGDGNGGGDGSTDSGSDSSFGLQWGDALKSWAQAVSEEAHAARQAAAGAALRPGAVKDGNRCTHGGRSSLGEAAAPHDAVFLDVFPLKS